MFVCFVTLPVDIIHVSIWGKVCLITDSCTLKTCHEIVSSQLQFSESVLDLLSLLNTDVVVFFRSQSCDLSRTAEMCRLVSVSQDQVWRWISSQARRASVLLCSCSLLCQLSSTGNCYMIIMITAVICPLWLIGEPFVLYI